MPGKAYFAALMFCCSAVFSAAAIFSNPSSVTVTVSGDLLHFYLEEEAASTLLPEGYQPSGFSFDPYFQETLPGQRAIVYLFAGSGSARFSFSGSAVTEQFSAIFLLVPAKREQQTGSEPVFKIQALAIDNPLITSILNARGITTLPLELERREQVLPSGAFSAKSTATSKGVDWRLESRSVDNRHFSLPLKSTTVITTDSTVVSVRFDNEECTYLRSQFRDENLSDFLSHLGLESVRWPGLSSFQLNLSFSLE